MSRDLAQPSTSGDSIAPDIHSASEVYALRFSGIAGEYLLSVQSKAIEELALSDWPEALPRTVLDVGGGHGQLIPLLKVHDFEVVVQGSSVECSRILAQSNNPQESWEFLVSSLAILPMQDKSFHLVCSVRMMAHFENWEALVAELCRVS